MLDGFTYSEDAAVAVVWFVLVLAFVVAVARYAVYNTETYTPFILRTRDEDATDEETLVALSPVSPVLYVQNIEHDGYSSRHVKDCVYACEMQQYAQAAQAYCKLVLPGEKSEALRGVIDRVGDLGYFHIEMMMNVNPCVAGKM